MASSRHKGLSWLCVFCAGCLMLSAATAAAAVTNVADVARAVLEPWAGEVAFDLTATVTCVIPCENKLSFVTISDRSGDVFITVPDASCRSPYSRGDLVRIAGSTWKQPCAGSLADCRSLDVLAHGQPPTPPLVSLADVLRGRYDWKFICVSGTSMYCVKGESEKTLLGSGL